VSCTHASNVLVILKACRPGVAIAKERCRRSSIRAQINRPTTAGTRRSARETARTPVNHVVSCLVTHIPGDAQQMRQSAISTGRH
jgi:hypothetical protein